MQSICVTALRGYKLLISPWLPSACRFHPTCSVYMREAIEQHGVPKGVWLGIKRLSRCHPFHQGGIDPVPGSVSVRGPECIGLAESRAEMQSLTSK